jgi:Ner family transcriptional regulator
MTYHFPCTRALEVAWASLNRPLRQLRMDHRHKELRTDWHPEKIKTEILKRGLSLYELENKFQLTRKSVGGCLYQPNPVAEKVIAKFIGVHPRIIWPSRYDTRGKRLQPQPLANYKKSSWRQPDRWAA